MITKNEKLLKEIANMIFFWFFGILFFAVFRTTFILLFKKQIAIDLSLSELSKVFLMGFRFDCITVAYFVLLPFLSLLLLSYFNAFKIIRLTRIFSQYLFVVLSTVICFVTLNYFSEYHNQFNNFLFLGLYDDQKAVFNTILEDFHPIANLVGMLVAMIIGILIFRHFENKDLIYRQIQKIHSKTNTAVVLLISLVLFVFSIRGSVTSVPAIRKWAGVSKDIFLNKTIINPFKSLLYALEDFNEINVLDSANPYLDDKEFYTQFSKPLVSDYILKKAKGATISKPKQIFIVIMESYDSWPLMDKYLPFQFSSQLNAIKNKGTHFDYFLPAADATFDSFGAIVTNVPYMGVNISKVGEINEPYVTSIFKQFKKLGYETNLFYGGFSSWQNINGFAKYQGVDRFFSATDAGGNSESGTWGIEDEKLFDLVLSKTDTTKYSLNIILTSSYHAPYTVDVYAKGFPYKSANDFPKSVKKYYDGGMTFDEMGHLWYGDYAIGKFIEKADRKYSDAIYTFTGDHFGRRFVNSKPNLYERSSVGFIMYGKNIPQAKLHTAGSHIDIMPTLIEMVAPKDFEYYSFGTSLFDPNKTSSISYSKIITTKELYFLPKEASVEKIDLETMKEFQINATPYLSQYNKQMGLAWYYTLKGNKLKK